MSPRVQNKTLAQVYAAVVGVVLVLAGIIGFLYSGAFGSPGNSELIFGVLRVNGWHNLVHLTTGALGIAVAWNPARSRVYALGLGSVYLVIAVWGILLGTGEAILGFVPVNIPDDLLHLALAILGLGTGLSSHDSATGE